MQTNGSTKSGPRLSVSTWSLHRTLGKPGFYGVGQGIPQATHGRGACDLLGLPARLAQCGIPTLEICHFHLPSREFHYLDEVSAALDEHGIELFSLLVDDGDIIHPADGAAHLAWIAEWAEVAAGLGSACMRVIAGKQQAGPENTALACSRLRQLSDVAAAQGVRLMTENWFALLERPTEVLEVLDRLAGDAGLCMDFGNWKGPEKYAAFEQIAGRAESCHAKPQFNDSGQIESADFSRCLEVTRNAGFAGPYTLIYDGPDDNEWEGLEKEKEMVLPYTDQGVTA
jgi:sugar phosphate isomerase/epimerase